MGLYHAELSDGGAPRVIGSYESVSPSYIIRSLDGRYIYAANEAGKVDGVPGGAVTAFRVSDGGAPEKVVTRTNCGGAPCHLMERGGYLYVSNYGDGSVTVYPLEDGVPGEAEFKHQHEGSGPVKGRQGGPHAHCTMAVPGGGEICVVDLGIDQARFYRKEGKALALAQALTLSGGDGPRHVAFSGDGRFGWIVTELSCKVYSIRRGAGGWEITGEHPTLPAGYAGESSCAAVRLTGDGKLLAASNRGHDSIAVFDVDGGTGLLTPAGIFPVGGATPRDIGFSPDGRWLVSANQDSDSVTVLSVRDGFKVAEGAIVSVSKPTSILF